MKSPKIQRWIGLLAALLRHYPLADEDGAVRHVLQFGPDITVLEPVEVREGVRRRLEAMVHA